MTRDQHIAQAVHNEELSEYLLNNAPEYTDWAQTAVLYAAVHMVDAYYVHRHVSLPYDWNHDKRRAFVLSDLFAVRTEYETLYRRSVDSRYTRRYPLYRNAKQTVIDLRNRELFRIKRHLRSFRLPIP